MGLCVLYLSLLLRGFEEQRINHCDSVSLNVLIRPVARERELTIKGIVHQK